MLSPRSHTADAAALHRFRSGKAPVAGPRGGLLPYRSTAITDHIDRRPEADSVLHCKTDGAYLEHHAAPDNQHPLDAMRFSIRQSNNPRLTGTRAAT